MGSANLDTTLAVGARLPTRGETVSACGDPLRLLRRQGREPGRGVCAVGRRSLEIAFYGRVGSDRPARFW